MTHTDRSLPNALDAEKAVLGTLLIAPADTLPAVKDRLSPGDFYSPQHQTIYGAILALPTPDLTLLTVKLTDTGKLEAAGGAMYLTDLLTSSYDPGRIEQYVEVIEQKSRLRQYISFADRTLDAAYSTDDPAGFLDGAEKDMLRVTAAAHGRDTARSMAQGSQLFMERLASRLDVDTHGVTGMPTGYGKLDKYTTGLHPLFYLIVARPGVGKTVLLENIARTAALDGHPVGFFSLEMSLEELMERSYSSTARVASMALRTGMIGLEEHARVIEAHSQLCKAPFHVDDTPGLDILELRRRARRMVRQHGIRALFVDYAQLIQCNSKKGSQNEIWALNEVSAGLKNLQRELNIAVVASAQLNRETEKRGEGSGSKLSDIKGSGAFEQDADAVFALNRKVGADDPDEERKTTLQIVKQRHGPLGKIPLTFLKDVYTFASAAE